jgi:phage terminase small subunit
VNEVNEQHKQFADYYIESGNATESYKRAGYKAKGKSAEVNASRLLSNAKVQEYIKKVVSEKSKERIASQDEVLQFLTNVLRGEETERIPMFAKDHFELIDNTPSIKDRTKAAELLGKRYTLWTDKTQLEGTIGVTIVDDIDD